MRVDNPGKLNLISNAAAGKNGAQAAALWNKFYE